MWSFSLLFLCVVPMVLSEEKLLLPLEKELAPDPIEPCKIRREFSIPSSSSPATENEKTVKVPSGCT
uniref:CUZD1 n=1 Tax=Steinernema glaseri TaxID=37863 RepID=A0A1I8A2Q4_9BILA